MGLFDTMAEPVFLKESSSAVTQLQQLQELSATAAPELKRKIERDIRLLNAGIAGENAIAFELKNSHMPMYILHDLCLSCSELSAQIDYLVITRKRVFVLEAKNLFGDIEITSGGDFIRTIRYNSHVQKEGIYSPITQNQRHLELIRQIGTERKKSIIQKAMFKKLFPTHYRSVVVLANPKTVLNARYAKKEIKDQVIRADQLIAYLKKVNAEPGDVEQSDREMLEQAQLFLSLHQESQVDYTEKYRQQMETGAQTAVQAQDQVPAPKDPPLCPRCGAPMVLRTAKKGDNAGNEFYGCSRFPKCRGIVNL